MIRYSATRRRAAIGALAVSLCVACAPMVGERNASERLQSVARSIDLDGDRELTPREIERAGFMLPELDANGDGSLDRYEMGGGPVKGMLRLQPVIRVLDRNGDLLISRVEMRRAADVLPQLDVNGDGIIGWDEAIGSSAAPTRDTRRLMHYEDAVVGPILPGAGVLAYDGYLFYHESNSADDVEVANKTYLVAPDGSVAHVWNNLRHSPEGAGAYLIDNGLLLRQSSAANWLGRGDYPVGSHGIVELVDWDGNTVWEYSRCERARHCLHHDMEPLPNGNVLVSSYEAVEPEQLLAVGWEPDLDRLLEPIWLESILELAPNLTDGSTEEVWRWNSWDHLVQEFNPTKPKYGVVAESLGLLDLNYSSGPQSGALRLFHINALSYNAALDQILVSSAAFGEVWILDHSTTTAEAATGSGGRYGKGGRILFRWGNPAAYQAGTDPDRVLFWAHDAHWVRSGLPNAGGQILIHNNGLQRNLAGRYHPSRRGLHFGDSYTDLIEVALPVGPDGAYGPASRARVVWRYEGTPRESYYSPLLSGLRRLPNGNTIATVGYSKRIIELTPQGEKVLDYFVPGPGQLFRIDKLSREHPGLRALPPGES